MRASVVSGGVVGLVVLMMATAPAFVRAKLEATARERGLEASVEEVRLGLARVWLKGLRVSSPGDQVELRIDALSFGLWSGGVHCFGGSLRGVGDPEAILERWRGSARGGSAGVDRTARDLVVEGLFLDWRRGTTGVVAFGVSARKKGDGGWGIRADLGRAVDGKRRAEARSIALDVAGGSGARRLSGLTARSVDLVWADEERRAVLEPPRVGAGRHPSSSGAGEPAPSGVGAGDDRAPTARLRGLRAVVLGAVRERLSEKASLVLDGVSARLERGRETLSFGPSRLRVGRDGEMLRVALTPSSLEPGAMPLSVSAVLPLSSGGVHLVAQGGPVSFASLGLRHGELGLQNVRQTTLSVDGSADFGEDLESVTFGGKASVRGLTLQRPALAPEPVGPWSFDASVNARAELDGSALRVSSAELRWDDVRVELSGELAQSADRRRIEGRLRVPLAGCQAVLDAMPNGLVPLVRELKLGGSFGIDLQVLYDSATPKDTHVSLAVQNECRIRESPPALSPHRFEHPFVREVKAADGSPMTVESGPGTPSWVSLDDISRHMETAILICEDAGFHAHSGFDFRALESAIGDDLKQGRFARGASTVSMQLAKNLYLGREKTLARKVQEAFLTMLLEQGLDKRRILELYLNVVELGPGLYGVGDAAQYYFATPARSLTLGQSLYLASLLPNPTFSHFGPDGKITPGWLQYIHRLMQIAHKLKLIDDAELQAGLEEVIAFRVPGESVPAERNDDEEPDAPALPELDDSAGQ